MTFDEFITAHEAALRPLLPAAMWPPVPCKVEHFGPLTKYTLGPLEDGRWAMLHHIAQLDQSAPHCHPCPMESTVLAGGYWERIWLPGGGTQDVRREPGSSHLIAADCIHRLTSLPTGYAWTLVKAGPVVRQWRHYAEFV